jgi:hypothetical protein
MTAMHRPSKLKGSQRAASVKAPLIADRRIGLAVVGLKGSDRFSASTVTT